MRAMVFSCICCFALSAGVIAAEDADAAHIARGLFEAAYEQEKDGQQEQAKRRYLEILENHPASEVADDARLALSRMDWPLDEARQLGRMPVDVERMQSARLQLEAIRSAHASSPLAPEALWRLALLYLEPAAPFRHVDEASALLGDLTILYRRSPFVSQALVLGARLALDAGRGEKARDLAFELLSRRPHDPLGAQAFLIMAEVESRQGRWRESLAELGRAQLRAGDDAEASSEALDRATLIDRMLYAASRRGGKTFLPTEIAWQPLEGKVSGLRTSAAGDTIVVQEKHGQALVFPRGEHQPTERLIIPDVRHVAQDAWGAFWNASATAIRPPAGREEIRLPEKIEIQDMAIVGPSSLWVIDARSASVVLLDGQSGVLQRIALSGRSDFHHLCSTAAGGIWLLDAKAPALSRVGAKGQTTSLLEIDSQTTRPVDLACDVLGNAYVLDARAARVVVFSSFGEVIGRLDLPHSGEKAVKKPTFIAVDRAGRVAVYDAKRKGIAWFH